MADRITTRDYTNMFLRQGVDATPGPRVSNDIQLVQITDDLSDLVLPLPAPSSIVGPTVPVAPAGRFAVFQLLAPATRVCIIPEIIGDPIQILNIGIGAAALPANLIIPPGLSWGPAPLAQVRAGDVHRGRTYSRPTTSHLG